MCLKIMLSQNETDTNIEEKTQEHKPRQFSKYNQSVQINSIEINDLNSLLEKEKEKQKREQWTKIDRTTKTILLHSFAEHYGNENKLPIKEIKNLKLFFNDCLNKDKLQKNKDVTYDKENQIILAIPALHFNSDRKMFTLRIMDNKRVSTLKSLTPKKTKL